MNETQSCTHKIYRRQKIPLLVKLGGSVCSELWSGSLLFDCSVKPLLPLPLPMNETQSWTHKIYRRQKIPLLVDLGGSVCSGFWSGSLLLDCSVKPLLPLPLPMNETQSWTHKIYRRQKIPLLVDLGGSVCSGFWSGSLLLDSSVKPLLPLPLPMNETQSWTHKIYRRQKIPLLVDLGGSVCSGFWSGSLLLGSVKPLLPLPLPMNETQSWTHKSYRWQKIPLLVNLGGSVCSGLWLGSSSLGCSVEPLLPLPLPT